MLYPTRPGVAFNHRMATMRMRAIAPGPLCRAGRPTYNGGYIRKYWPMSFTLWRGVAGMVKPTRRPGSLES